MTVYFLSVYFSVSNTILPPLPTQTNKELDALLFFFSFVSYLTNRICSCVTGEQRGGSVMMIHSLYHHPYKGYISAMCVSSSAIFKFSFPPKRNPEKTSIIKEKKKKKKEKKNVEWVVHYVGQQKQPSSGGLVFSCVVTAIRRRRIKINVFLCALSAPVRPCRLCKTKQETEATQKKKRTKKSRDRRSKNGERGKTVKTWKLLKIK